MVVVVGGVEGIAVLVVGGDGRYGGHDDCSGGWIAFECCVNQKPYEHSSWQAITPARHGEGTYTANHNDRYRGAGTP